MGRHAPYSQATSINTSGSKRLWLAGFEATLSNIHPSLVARYVSCQLLFRLTTISASLLSLSFSLSPAHSLVFRSRSTLFFSVDLNLSISLSLDLSLSFSRSLLFSIVISSSSLTLTGHNYTRFVRRIGPIETEYCKSKLHCWPVLFGPEAIAYKRWVTYVYKGGVWSHQQLHSTPRVYMATCRFPP